jgi:hypothetical protein
VNDDLLPRQLHDDKFLRIRDVCLANLMPRIEVNPIR